MQKMSPFSSSLPPGMVVRSISLAICDRKDSVTRVARFRFSA